MKYPILERTKTDWRITWLVTASGEHIFNNFASQEDAQRAIDEYNIDIVWAMNAIVRPRKSNHL